MPRAGADCRTPLKVGASGSPLLSEAAGRSGSTGRLPNPARFPQFNRVHVGAFGDNGAVTDRIPWERYSGEDVEAVVALFVLRDNPHGNRRLPAQGDHGIDVLVRNDDGSWSVWQVKRYTDPLDSSQRRSITKSWNRLQEYVRGRGITLRDWWVARPRDPTDGDERWLAELTAGSGVPTHWLGLANLDAWTTRYPEVVDYYLHGGRDRAFDYAMRALQAARLLGGDSDKPLDPDGVELGLEAVFHAVNDRDPHYRYEFQVRAPRPFDESELAEFPEDLAWRATVTRPDVEVVTEVFRRYDQAGEDSPLQLEVFAKPESDEDRQQLRDHREYGLPLVGLPVEVAGSLPGFALSGAHTATITSVVGRSGRHSGPHLLNVSIGEEHPVAGTALMSDFVRGENGGWSWSGRIGGVAMFSTLGGGEPAKQGITMRPFSIEGMTPAEADLALTLMRATMSVGKIELRLPDGPIVLEMKSVDAGSDDDTLAEALRSLDRTLQVVRALRTLQTRIPVALRVPDRSELTIPEIDAWVRAADLLTGTQRVAQWEPFLFTADIAHPQLPAAFKITIPLKVTIGGQVWQFGWMTQQGVAASQELQGDGRLLLRPGDDARLIQTVTTDPDDIRHSGRVFFASLGVTDRG